MRAPIPADPGDRIVDIESTETGEEADHPHAVLVIRAARDGTVLGTIDPCPTCTYSAPAWSTDGQALTFLAASDNGFSASLFVVFHVLGVH